MLMRLNCWPKMFMAPSTMSQLSRMGMKPSRVCLTLNRNDSHSTNSTKAIDSHCRRSKSLLIWSRVSVV